MKIFVKINKLAPVVIQIIQWNAQLSRKEVDICMIKQH